MKKARIIVTRHYGPFGSIAHTYAWDGPIDAPVLVGDELRDTRYEPLPWPLTVIERQEWAKGNLCVRTDARWWRVTAARYALRRAWEWFTARAVLTLYVWGLARYEHGRHPSWKDVGRR